MLSKQVYEQVSLQIQRGFRKRYSAQDCLLVMLEKSKKTVESGNVFGALKTDLSKAFDCIPYDLKIAKLNSYGLIYLTYFNLTKLISKN